MPFLITLAEEDTQISCEEDQTVLDAALEKGITISYGCRNGQCGSCMGELIDGQVSYPEGQPPALVDEDMESGKALFCKAVPEGDITIKVKVLKPQVEIVVKTLPAKVSQIENLTDDVIKLILKLPAVEPFNFRAGQWVYFVLKDGKKRAFSIANSPNDKNELELQIRHAVGGVFTDFVFDNLKTGLLLKIEGPHGTFYFQKDDQPILLVAGGTGFAPIKGIFEEISQLEQRPPVHVFWGSRAGKDLYQNDLVEQWVKEFGINYTPVLSDPDENDNWQGLTGFVHEAVIKTFPDLSPYAIYMAGPPQMIESCKSAFTEAGLHVEKLYYDSFDYSTDALDAMKAK